MLEVGAGVGLTGLVASHFAKYVLFSITARQKNRICFPLPNLLAKSKPWSIVTQQRILHFVNYLLLNMNTSHMYIYLLLPLHTSHMYIYLLLTLNTSHMYIYIYTSSYDRLVLRYVCMTDGDEEHLPLLRRNARENAPKCSYTRIEKGDTPVQRHVCSRTEEPAEGMRSGRIDVQV